MLADPMVMAVPEHNDVGTMHSNQVLTCFGSFGWHASNVNEEKPPPSHNHQPDFRVVIQRGCLINITSADLACKSAIFTVAREQGLGNHRGHALTVDPNEAVFCWKYTAGPKADK